MDGESNKGQNVNKTTNPMGKRWNLKPKETGKLSKEWQGRQW